MIVFKYQYDANSPVVTYEMHPQSTLPEVVEGFELFLKAAGYEFKGQLDFNLDEVPTFDEKE